MKLVKIEDVRVEQIWQLHNLIGLVKEIDKGSNNLLKIVLFQLFYPTEGGIETESVHNIITKHKLIGKLGITHEIKDNRLVEIQEKTKDKTIYFIDDVVKYQDCEGNSFSAVINQKEVSPLYNYYVATNTLGCFVELSDNLEDQEGLETDEYTYFPMEKIGILGVTHEFVNDCEVRND